MFKRFNLLVLLLSAILWMGCGGGDHNHDSDSASHEDADGKMENDSSDFQWQTEQFADLRILRYQIPGWERLSSKQQELVYYLNQAGLSGRDIMYDQNYRHNLHIRKGLEKIFQNYEGDKESDDWKAFDTYIKRVWFSNGIHHHYSNNKIMPEFSEQYLNSLCDATSTDFNDEARKAMFDPAFDNKKVEQDGDKGLLESSAVNFYATDVSTEEAKAFYAKKIEKNSRAPISYGLNSKLVKNKNGEVEEAVWYKDGMYGSAIEQIIYWLKKAETVAENDKQAAGLRKLVKYYETGDLKEWDIYNINWASDTEGDIDYINGFIEVYNDPLGYRGSYETIIEITDFDASARMSVVMDNVQWFEDHSPFLPQHKKESVVGVTYKVVNVAGEAGDASPSTPIGVNLPNSNWIRALHGSKSVSLGNIVEAYDEASGSGMLEEFANDQEEIDRVKAHGKVAGKLHTALHEVVGHASGKLEEGVSTPKETIQEYASTLEEGRADLVALYFMMDSMLIELGLMESLEVGMAEYDSYIRNGLLAQLRRLEMGDDIQEAHMRNRAWVSRWVLEKGQVNNVIEKLDKGGSIYYNINDYEALRGLFGELLREVQRIKSQGDYAAAKALVEGYGVKVDPVVHQQVLDRTAKMETAPYGGFINPQMVAKTDDAGKVTGIELTYPNDFAKQMLYYSKNYNFLPEYN